MMKLGLALLAIGAAAIRTSAGDDDCHGNWIWERCSWSWYWEACDGEGDTECGAVYWDELLEDVYWVSCDEYAQWTWCIPREEDDTLIVCYDNDWIWEECA